MASGAGHLLREPETSFLSDIPIEGQIQASLRTAGREQLEGSCLSSACVSVDAQSLLLQKKFAGSLLF